MEKKTEEYKYYADQIKALIQQYVPPDKDLIEQARQNGNIMLGPAAGAPGEYRQVLSNYIKQGDSMTLVIDKAQKDLASLSISTYLSDPSDAVKRHSAIQPSSRWTESCIGRNDQRRQQKADDRDPKQQLPASVELRVV